MHPYTADCSGFSLVEILVALAVVSIITTAVVFTFNSSKAKAETILQFSNKVYNAVQRFEIDTGCVPHYKWALTSKAFASSPSSNSCNANVSARWNGPYLESIRNIQKALGPNGGFWLDTFSNQWTPQGFHLIFFLQKPIELQVKRLHPNGFKVFWCRNWGSRQCLIRITH